MNAQPIEYGRESALTEMLVNLSPPKCTPRLFVKNAVQIAAAEDSLTKVLLTIPHPSWIKIEEAARVVFGEEYVSAAVLSAVYTLRSKNRRQPVKRDWNDLFHCHLCWRFTPGTGKFKRLCPEHTPTISQAGYKYAKRLEAEFKRQVRKIRSELALDTQDSIPPNKGGIRKYLKRYYPHIAKISSSNNLRLLIDELDCKDDPLGTRATLHDRIVAEPEEALSFLRRCEAWHRAKESRVHGGRRKGAGRPRKNN